MHLRIRSIGTAVPPTVLKQADALKLARVLCSQTPEQATWLPGMYDGTGIRTRRVVLSEQLIRDVIDGTAKSRSVFLPTGLPEDRGPTTAQRLQIYAQEAGPLALRATGQALVEAACFPDSITHIVTASCTGFTAPGVDQFLIRELGLRTSVQRIHVGYMGCHGAVNALRVAQALAAADRAATVLVCAVELCSLHYHYGWDPQRIIANALFGDGAAAVVCDSNSEDDAASWRLAATGSSLFPDSAADMAWTIGDHGFEMTLSKRVPGLIARCLRPWLETWLAENGLRREEVGSWAIHPGGPRIVQAVQESLDLTDAALAPSRSIFAEFGNMSSPTVLFILDRLRCQNAPRPCVMLGFGPGLVAEAALLR